MCIRDSGRIDGVYPFFRGGAMAAAPPNPDGELVKGRHAAAGGGNHGAAGDVGPQQGADMEAEDGVHSVQRPLLQHDFGSLTLLLGRLEEEADGAPELLPVFLQDLGGPHEPVSYTHLDVYKRQASASSSRSAEPETRHRFSSSWMISCSAWGSNSS